MEKLLQKALEAVQKGERYAFATVVESTVKGTPQKSGAKMIVLEDGTIWGTIGGGRNEKAAQKECLKAIKNKKSKVVTYDFFGQEGQSVCGGQIKVFIEPAILGKQFIICGGGHIALPLSFQTKLLDYKTTIIDSRRAFANKKRFPHADRILVGEHAKQLKKIKIDENTYIMIVTHGNEHDYECLKAVIQSKASYIGCISSKAKKVKFTNRLKKENVPQKLIDRVKIPAGVDIGAQTPEEIAVSIISEVIKEHNQDFLNTAKFRAKSKT